MNGLKPRGRRIAAPCPMVPNHRDKIDRYVDRMQRLAPAPKVVAQVLLLFADPNREVDRLAELNGRRHA